MDNLYKCLFGFSGKKLAVLLCFGTIIFFFYLNKQLHRTKYSSRHLVSPSHLPTLETNTGRLFDNVTKAQNMSTTAFLTRKVQTKYILDCFGDACNENVSVYKHEIIRNSMNKIANDLSKSGEASCPEKPPDLVGLRTKNGDHTDLPTWENISSTNPNLQKGGRYSPTNCVARYKVAIVIPLRDRETQLRTLLAHMHPIWQRQQLDYTVYTITQGGNYSFNRAKLMNIGFAEARKERRYDCYVFHDVDLLLENDECLYWCLESNPRHLATFVDKFNYEPVSYGLQCTDGVIHYYGGASMMTESQMLRSNGFSNLYWGWGGEDDDMFIRLQNKGYEIENPYKRNCSYSMIKHKHESSNSPNLGRNQLLKNIFSRQDDEGLNTLRYKVISTERMLAYTNVTVDVGRATEKMANFMNKDGPCSKPMPWEL